MQSYHRAVFWCIYITSVWSNVFLFTACILSVFSYLFLRKFVSLFIVWLVQKLIKYSLISNNIFFHQFYHFFVSMRKENLLHKEVMPELQVMYQKCCFFFIVKLTFLFLENFKKTNINYSKSNQLLKFTACHKYLFFLYRPCVCTVN